MSAHGADRHDAARRASRSARRAGARTRSRAGRSSAGTVIALVPLVLIVYYLLQQGPRRVELGLLHDRPDRQHVLQDLEHRRHQERDPRHDRDRRARLARSRCRSAIGVAVWLVEYGRDSWFAQRRALLRRRAHRRALDRVRPVHLHRADRRHGQLLRRLQGLDRAVAADAARRHPLGRGDPAARARTRCANRRSRSGRRAGG